MKTIDVIKNRREELVRIRDVVDLNIRSLQLISDFMPTTTDEESAGMFFSLIQDQIKKWYRLIKTHNDIGIPVEDDWIVCTLLECINAYKSTRPLTQKNITKFSTMAKRVAGMLIEKKAYLDYCIREMNISEAE